MNATFLTVGEALTDIVITADGARHEYPGGSPLNVAVALGRLGHHSHLLTAIGPDARGDQIRHHVESSHVHLTPGSIGQNRTSTAEATLDATGAAQYTFDLAWDPDPRELPDQVDAVHTSSIAAVLAPGAATVADVLARYRASALISYDPNARPDLMGDPVAARALVEENIALADIVKCSDEDVAWLYGTDDAEDVCEGGGDEDQL
ncbi:MAG: PfkB family carbohydrate kinase, partial [Brachybacterium sp.]|nr:PfkB family carbohydrate kinase [Brachybacterium sp.]